MHALFNPVVYFIMSRTFRQSALQKFRQCTGFLKHKRCKDSPCRMTTHANLKTEDIPVSVSEFQHIYHNNLKGKFYFTIYFPKSRIMLNFFFFSS